MSELPKVPVRKTDNTASHSGAAAIQPHRTRLIQVAFATFVRAGDNGATNEDLYRDNPRIQEHSIRPRVAELIDKGWIYECGSRNGSHGVEITVWRLTEVGKEEAERQSRNSQTLLPYVGRRKKHD
jgi:hypothetical protein